MFTATRKFGLLARLGVLATAALVAQQAGAAGTDPGVVVENTATVNYNVSGTPQTAIDSNTSSFVVDRRVDFTVTQVGAALTQVTPGAAPVFVEFLVTNLSNGDLDFNLAFAQLTAADGDVRGAGTTDSGIDMNNVTIAVSAQSNNDAGGTGPDPVLGGPSVIDNLAEDDAIRVRLYAEAPLAFANGQISNLRLDATAADPGTGADLVESATWTPGTIDNVFADTDNDGIQSGADGFEAVTAALAINKTQAVDSDPLNSGLAIPGAIVEYTITLTNSGSAAADDVVLEDVIDTDVTFVAGSLSVGGSACVADNGDSNNDGCAFDGTTLTVNGPGGSPISIAGGGGTLVIVYQVEIPTTP